MKSADNTFDKHRDEGFTLYWLNSMLGITQHFQQLNPDKTLNQRIGS
jgi:hypothetical protein